MSKYIILICTLTLLTACKTEEEKRAEWIKICSANDFTEKQCGVLYLIAKGVSDANDSADMAAINSSIAIGLAAGRR